MDLFSFIAVVIIGTPIARAIATRIRGRRVANGAALREALESTGQRLADAEQRIAETADRLAEVEERLDFTERLLARQNAREQLGP